MGGSTKDILILGDGLSGLSSGYLLANAGFTVKIFERDAAIGVSALPGRLPEAY